MLIMLEGIDGVGKTTIAELLAPILDAEIIHATRETPNDFAWFFSIINKARTQNIIADRFFWGQFVYQEPEERKLSSADLRALEYMIHKSGGKIIYVTAPRDIVEQRLKKREEKLSLPFETLYERYELLVDTAKVPIIKYDTSCGKVGVTDVGNGI